MAEQIDYPRYLASREWAVRREAVRKRADGTCERCYTLPMKAVHHLTYENTGHEPLADLQAICRPCHDYESGVALTDPDDVQRWIFNAGFSQEEMADRWGRDWKDRYELMWAARYGAEWEREFIDFCIQHPAIAN